MKSLLHKSGILLFLSLLLAHHGAPLYSEFIENEDKEDVVVAEPKTEGLPVYIGYNLKAEKMNDRPGSVKITWNVNEHYTDQFIIGRSSEIIDTGDRALASKSVTVLGAKSSMEYIDEDLKPGRYYYVVLAKDKIQNRDIELYRNVNYTSSPIEIEKPPAKIETSEHATMIAARASGAFDVLLSWHVVDPQGKTFHIYRAATPLSGIDDLKKADHVAIVADVMEYRDSKLSPGTYYYAITMEDASAVDTMVLVPDQNYMTSGIAIAGAVRTTVSGIRARSTGDDVRITWSPITGEGRGKVKEYRIYRSGSVINTAEALGSSVFLGSVQVNTVDYIDKKPGPGSHYYAVISVVIGAGEDAIFLADENFTLKSVDMIKNLYVRSFDANHDNGDIVIKWDFNEGAGQREFFLFRSGERARRYGDVKKSDIIAKVDIARKSYIDVEPPEGVYYYGLVPEITGDNKLYRLKPGVTMVKGPVTVSRDREGDFKEQGGVGNLEEILKKTYFRGRYKRAIKELQYVIRNSDNKIEVAKAKLFMGRAYIETRDYRLAISFLVSDDVKKYFPDESQFWLEYAIMRVTKY